MVDYNRKKVKVRKTSVDFDYDKLSDVLEEIQTLIKDYGPDAFFIEHEDDYSDTKSLYLYVDEDETDEQMKNRIALEEAYEKRRDEHDRLRYEELKKKFG